MVSSYRHAGILLARVQRFSGVFSLVIYITCYMITAEDLQNNRVLRYEGCFGFHRNANAKGADYMRERNFLGESHVYSYGTTSVFHIGRENRWEDGLLSLAFATRWNPKHPSYLSTRLFCNSISQLCWGEQTI